MALLSVALALFTISRRRWALLLTVFLVAFGHYVLAYLGRATVLDSNVPIILAAWLPNIVLVSIAGGVMGISSRAGNADGRSRSWCS
jgi:lipopolysaccharide export LptBFGC system permease protein LptF